MKLERLRVLVLFVFLGLLAWGGIGLTKLQFAFSFESFLPPDDEDLYFYRKFNDEFSKGESAISAVFVREAGVFEAEFLAKVDSFTRKARKLSQVTEAHSLLTLKDIHYSPMFPLAVPVLDWRDAEDLEEQGREILKDERWWGNFISKNGKMMVVQLNVKNGRSDQEEAELVESVLAIGDGMGFERWHAVGFPVAHYELLRLQKQQFSTYVALAAIVMFLCMVMLFRRLWGIIVSFFSVFSGMIIFFGMLGWIGHPLDLMATLFPILLVIVGTSDVVHLMTKYVDELQRGRSKQEALMTTLKEIGMATFMTSFTTAIGFLSLLGSNMPPIRDFGIFSALGVMMTFICVILLTTALISWFGPGQLMRLNPAKPLFAKPLKAINRFTLLRSRPIAIGTVVVLLLSIGLASRISTNLTAQRDLPRNSRILDAYLAVDSSMGGLDAISVAMLAQEGHSFHDWETQKELDKLEAHLRQDPLVGPIYSPNTFFKLANRYYSQNIPGSYVLPATLEASKKQRKVIEKHLAGPLSSVLSKDGKTAKLYVNLPDIGSRRVAEFTERMDVWIASHISPEIIQFKHTGHRHILDKNQEMLAASLMKSLIFAFLIVAICMAFLFRNFKMVIISLIPNVVPLIVTAGLIGLLGFELDPKVAIVFTVAFGIAVDDSIHFLARYRLERQKGLNIDQAIEATFQETGKAMIYTTIILFLGFGTLCFSNFPPTFTIGLLLSITLFVALVADFLLLPLGLRWGGKKVWD